MPTRVRVADGVRWTGLYQPAYKISRAFNGAAASGPAEAKVLLFPDERVTDAASALLAAGAPADIPDAVYAYNHSWEYVAMVLGRMAAYGTPGPDPPNAIATAVPQATP